jgi:hypothetical protein
MVYSRCVGISEACHHAVTHSTTAVLYLQRIVLYNVCVQLLVAGWLLPCKRVCAHSAGCPPATAAKDPGDCLLAMNSLCSYVCWTSVI